MRGKQREASFPGTAAAVTVFRNSTVSKTGRRRRGPVFFARSIRKRYFSEYASAISNYNFTLTSLFKYITVRP
jgi:hypothetical protein